MTSEPSETGNPLSGPEVGFRLEWRQYQARVLSDLEAHFADGHLHLVAAPGSGKTVLGLEIIRRLGKPSLVVSPTLAIRNQWIDRFVSHFLPEGSGTPDWLSTDLSRPGVITSTTYQALHAALTGQMLPDPEEDEAGEQEDASGEITEENPNLFQTLRTHGVEVLVVDECHHLRAAWWRTLTSLKGYLKPMVVALTATPPYDVSPAEFANYRAMCGPVDAEVSVPELVKRGDLCPHQDLVYLSLPTRAESEAVTRVRQAAENLLQELKREAWLQAAVSTHPSVVAPDQNLEAIYGNPDYYASLAFYLNAATGKPPARLVEVLGLEKKRLPEFDLRWLEVMLQGMLSHDQASFAHCDDRLKALRRRLNEENLRRGTVVTLLEPEVCRKTLAASAAKLESVLEIVRTEWEQMGEDLRLVALTDFIRPEELPVRPGDERPLAKIGSVPIFEVLRRELKQSGVRIGVLTGSLVIVPASAESEVLEQAEGLGIAGDEISLLRLPHDPEYSRLTISGPKSHRMVALVTQVFQAGGMQVLVGTKSLLGEGWDAPFVNSLVLATYVGSFVLSNQMRGRAIRSLSGNPEKTANIWSLACIEPGYPGGGPDLALLERRFRTFQGLDREAGIITSGLARLKLPPAPISASQAEAFNQAMHQRAANRQLLEGLWKSAIAEGQDLEEQVLARPRATARREVVVSFRGYGTAFGAFVLGAAASSLALASVGAGPAAHAALEVLRGAMGLGAVACAPAFLRRSHKLFLHRNPQASLKALGTALVRSLSAGRIFTTSPGELSVQVESGGNDHCAVWLDGGTRFEKQIFQEQMAEILGRPENPRYLLKIRHGRKGDTRYVPVPSRLTARKPLAEEFWEQWNRLVCPAMLVYTRNPEGRLELLKAREQALVLEDGAVRLRSAWR